MQSSKSLMGLIMWKRFEAIEFVLEAGVVFGPFVAGTHGKERSIYVSLPIYLCVTTRSTVLIRVTPYMPCAHLDFVMESMIC